MIKTLFIAGGLLAAAVFGSVQSFDTSAEVSAACKCGENCKCVDCGCENGDCKCDTAGCCETSGCCPDGCCSDDLLVSACCASGIGSGVACADKECTDCCTKAATCNCSACDCTTDGCPCPEDGPCCCDSGQCCEGGCCE